MTAFNALMWESGITPSRTIDHGVVVPDVPWTGETEAAVAVAGAVAAAGFAAAVAGVGCAFAAASPPGPLCAAASIATPLACPTAIAERTFLPK